MPGPSYHGRTHGVADSSGTYVDTGTDPITGLAAALNAVGGGGGGGIQFSVANVGAWLDVQTNTADPDGYAMHWVAYDEVFWDLDWTDAAALFHVEAHSVLIEALGTTGTIHMHSEYDANITADRNLALVGGTDSVAGAGISAVSSHGDINITSSVDAIGIQGQSGIALSSPVGPISFSSPLAGITFNSPTQQTTPVTLADVIAVLLSYGLTV